MPSHGRRKCVAGHDVAALRVEGMDVAVDAAKIFPDRADVGLPMGKSDGVKGLKQKYDKFECVPLSTRLVPMVFSKSHRRHTLELCMVHRKIWGAVRGRRPHLRVGAGDKLWEHVPCASRDTWIRVPYVE